MKKLIAAAALAGVLGFAGVAGAQSVAKPTTAKLVTKMAIRMPDDLGEHFKPGDGSVLATTNCIACHSSAYVSTQPPLDLAHWTAEVNKMRKVYGATFISDDDATKIAEYLTQTYGKPTP